jgi:hypothetical protein
MVPTAGLAAVCLFADVAAAFADAAALTSPPPPPIIPNPSTGGNLSNLLASAPYQFWLSCLIVFFGLAIIIGLVWSLMKMGSQRPEDISRPLIVITVIVGSLILVSAGYSNSQIAPAFGLFGTIVGYMLGHLTQSSATPDPPNPADDASPVPTPPNGGGTGTGTGNAPVPARDNGPQQPPPAGGAGAGNPPGRRAIEP